MISQKLGLGYKIDHCVELDGALGRKSNRQTSHRGQPRAYTMWKEGNDGHVVVIVCRKSVAHNINGRYLSIVFFGLKGAQPGLIDEFVEHLYSVLWHEEEVG
nr:hypothetical protein [Tanacetum cinerariifolium]